MKCCQQTGRNEWRLDSRERGQHFAAHAVHLSSKFELVVGTFDEINARLLRRDKNESALSLVAAEVKKKSGNTYNCQRGLTLVVTPHQYTFEWREEGITSLM